MSRATWAPVTPERERTRLYLAYADCTLACAQRVRMMPGITRIMVGSKKKPNGMMKHLHGGRVLLVWEKPE